MDRPIHRPLRVCLLLLCAVLIGGCSPQAQKARHLARAEKYREKQQYREAVIEYMNVLRADSTNRVAIRKMGLTLFDMGDWRAAFPYLQQADTADPADTETGWRLGSMYLSRGDRVQARKKADVALKRNPDHLEAIILWAGAAGSSNEVNEAIARLQSAATRLRQPLRLYLALGALQVQRRDFAAAEEAYQMALKQDAKAWEPHLALGDLYLLKRDAARAEQEYRIAADLSPQDSVARIRFARFQWASRKPKEAREILEGVTRKSPQFVPAWFQLAEFAHSERDFATCIDILNRILKQSPSHVDAFLLLQRVRLAQGKTDEAIAGYEKLVAAFPKIVQARFYLGMAFLQKGDVRKATAELEKAVELDPESTDAARALAELHIRLGNSDAALQLLSSLIRRYPDAGYAHVLMGAAYINKKNYPKAVEAYRHVIELAPTNPQGPYLLGMALQRQGKTTEAVAMYEASMKMAPGFVEALDRLAALEVERTGNWDTALIRIRKQIDVAPDQAGLLYLLGLAHLRRSDWDEAEHALLKAIEMQPEFMAAYLTLSQLYVARHKDDEALIRINTALSVNSNEVASLMMKGAILERKNEVAGAAEQYQRVLHSNPRNFLAANNLACLYANDPKKKNEAFELAKQARELAPRNPSVADTLGWIVYRRGEYKWALALLQESADHLPQQPEVLYHLGMCQAALGDAENAHASLSNALELEKTFPGSAAAGEMLSALSAGDNLKELGSAAQVELFLSKHPDNPFALIKGGAFYEQAGDYEHARTLYEKVIAQNEHFVPALISLARLYSVHLKQFDRAMAIARQAREEAPGDSGVADLLASLAYQKGDHKWAQSLLVESINRAGPTPERQYLLGMIHFAMGKTDAATNLIGQALNTAPGFASAAAARRMMERVRMPELAMGQMQAADLTNSLTVENLPLLMYVAGTYEQKGEKASARSFYDQAVVHYPGFSPAFRRLAVSYIGEKTISDKEFKVLTTARELLPDDLDVGRALGEAAFLRGQYEWASRLLLETTAKFPDVAEVYYYLGMSYHQLQKKDAAQKALRRALELDSRSGLASKAREILSQIQ